MAGTLDLVYVGIVVAIAVLGVLGVAVVTDNPDDTARGYGSELTAVAAALFVVATAWTVLG